MAGNCLEKELIEILGEEKILKKEPMRKHTTFRIGGEAEYFLMPSSQEEIIKIVELAKKCQIPCLTVGNGSNLLVSDKGIVGLVLYLGRNFCNIHMKGNLLDVQAGALLSGIAGFAAKHSLSGLEFAAGIPGSLGGAITMNAGAYGGEISQIVYSVCALTSQGKVKVFSKEEMGFGYRRSIVGEQELLILSAKLYLKEGNREEIFGRMKELAAKRREKQPLEFPSAGSTFKRPEGYFAGKLIMEAGLAGFQIGGARVSEKHCGFIINTGEAAAEDVAAVIWHVQNTVKEKFSVMLEPEVRFAGSFGSGGK